MFNAVYEYYRGKKLPEDQYLMNTLVREFGVPSKDAERCARIFRADMEYAGLLVQTKTGYFLTDDVEGAPAPTRTVVDNDGDEGSSEADASEVLTSPPAFTTTATVNEKPKPSAIFVGHGKDKRPLAQLERFLAEYKLPHKLAEREPNAGRPIPQKVADTMRECGAAILIFTPDEELRDLDGKPVFRPSENVAHELGACSVLYDNRIVIFKEKSVTLPTNYSSIGYIEFEAENLASKTIELFRELINFGLIKVSVGD